MCFPTRRDALRSLSALALGSTVASAGAAAERATVQEGRFDPRRHGFGFHNWSTTTPTYSEHDHDEVSEAQIERAIRSEWDDRLGEAIGLHVSAFPDRLVRTIARQVYVSANQFSATNGHCYGMVFAAQSYFEQPERIPEGYDVASEVDHPSAPVSDPDHSPIGEEIDLFQVLQILDPNSWLGRRAMLRPSWIDLDRQVENIRAVVDSYGTAGITVIDAASGASHQVLVHDVDGSGDRTHLDVYDPNVPAWMYARGHRTTVVVDGDGMEPYGRYTTFVFNRRDRITAARSGVDDPVPALDRSAERIRDLFSVALFLVDSPDVCLAVIDPDGEPVVRDEATFMDRSITPYHSMRYRYDAPTGEYGVAVTARADADYTLTVEAADVDRGIVAAEIDGSLAAGETHEYTVTLPAAGEGEGKVTRESVAGPWALAAGGAIAGAAVAGTVGYGLHRRRRRPEDGSHVPE